MDLALFDEETSDDALADQAAVHVGEHHQHGLDGAVFDEAFQFGEIDHVGSSEFLGFLGVPRPVSFPPRNSEAPRNPRNSIM